MSDIERVIKAHPSEHDLNPEQAALVRGEHSGFIAELISGRRPPTMFPGGSHRDGGEPSNHGSISKG
jgi:hypothetical protein